MEFVKKLCLVGAIFLLGCSIGHAQSKVIASKQDLDAGRVKIDSLDNQLIKILGERERIVKAIGVYKAKNHIPPLQPARFKEVVKKSVSAGKKEGLSAGFIEKLMNLIHDESIRIESDTLLMKH